MTNDLEHLMEKISLLPDADLLRMVIRDFAQYRIEAIAYAKAEAQRRGLSLDNPYVNDTSTLENKAGADKTDISEEDLDRPMYSRLGAGGKQQPESIVRYKIFRGTIATWDSLFSQAADFASEIGQKRLISISHSEDKYDGVVVVWFWAVEAA